MSTSHLTLTAKRIAIFWTNVERRGPNECWPYTGFTDRDGYGRCSVDRAGCQAHRVALAASGVMVLTAQLVLHSCDNRKCCNPAHLSLGTHQENMKERNQRNRQAKGERNGRAKLDSLKVLEIRADYAAGTPLKEIISRHNLNPFYARDIIKGKTWKHLLPKTQSLAA